MRVWFHISQTIVFFPNHSWFFSGILTLYFDISFILHVRQSTGLFFILWCITTCFHNLVGYHYAFHIVLHQYWECCTWAFGLMLLKLVWYYRHTLTPLHCHKHYIHEHENKILFEIWVVITCFNKCVTWICLEITLFIPRHA